MGVSNVLCLALVLFAPLNVAEQDSSSEQVTPIEKVLELMHNMLEKGEAAKKGRRSEILCIQSVVRQYEQDQDKRNC